MSWDKVKKAVGKVAPLVGAAINPAIGGPVGAMVAAALGVESEPDAVENAIKNDPNAALKLVELQNQEAENLRKHQFGILDVELRDKQDARKNHANHWMPSAICIALTCMVAGSTYLLFTNSIPDGNKEIAYLLFGALVAKWGDSIAYWVGTTRSSALKSFSRGDYK